MEMETESNDEGSISSIDIFLDDVSSQTLNFKLKNINFSNIR